MHGDAVVAHTEHGVHPIEAFERRATRFGHALVAGLRRVIEVGATRALQQVAAGRGLVAKLGRRAGENSLREQRIAPAHAHVGGSRVISTSCAGASICSFIRSTRFVPPAMNLAVGCAAEAQADATSLARW